MEQLAEKTNLIGKINVLMGVMINIGDQVEELKQKLKEIEDHENEKS